MIFEEIRKDFTEDMAQSLNKGLGILTFDDNMLCDIRTIEDVVAGDTFSISHNLKKTPKYRIILRQIGGENISDSDVWSDKSISLINNGATALRKLTVLIM